MKQITKDGIVSLGDFPQFTSDFFAGVSDGAGNFNGTATPGGSSKNISTYTLSRSVIYDSITMSNNTTLLTNGFKIFCKGNVTINAGCVISNDGLPGGFGTSSGGTGAAAAPVADAPLGGPRGGAGGAGENGAAAPVSGSPGILAGCPSLVSTGGFGGSGGGDATQPGSGGSTALNPPPGSFVEFSTLASPILALSGILSGGGAGGGGGGGTAAAGSTGGGGGGGGSGGGVVMLFINGALSNSGTISAVGGSGGRGGDATGTSKAGGGGGGGGGAGGLVCLFYQSYPAAGTVTVAGGGGGNGGTKIGALGVDGVGGQSGKPGRILKFNITSRTFE